MDGDITKSLTNSPIESEIDNFINRIINLTNDLKLIFHQLINLLPSIVNETMYSVFILIKFFILSMTIHAISGISFYGELFLEKPKARQGLVKNFVLS